jgi:O-antigen ligase
VVCAIAAPLAVHFINDSRHRWLPSIALVLLCGGVVASGSRGAQVVFPATVLAAFVVSAHKKKVMRRLAVTLGAAIFGGLIFLMQLAPGDLFRFNGNGKSADSDSARRDLMVQAWHDFKDYPIFGVGVKHITEGHDIYLQLMSAGGYVLLAGMLIYWFGTFRSCRLATRSGDALGPYLMTSVIAWLGIGAIENALTDRFLYYAVGCAAALAATHRVETPAGRVTAAVAGHPSTGQRKTASAAPAAVPMIEAPRVSRTPTGSLTDRRSVGYSGVTYAPTGIVYKGAPGC